MIGSGGPDVARPVLRRSVIVGLGRPQERRLLAACRDDAYVRVAARCSSAPEVLALIQQGSGDVALLDEDLHLLDDEHLAHLDAAATPTVILAREPEDQRWQEVRSVVVLSADAEPSEVLIAVRAARHDERRIPARQEPRGPIPSASPDSSRPGHLQVLTFWSGPGSPGRTTLAINWGVLLGWVARTVIVDLDLTGSSVTAQLDESRHEPGQRGWVASSILQLASVRPDRPESWLHEIFRVARPLGPSSPQADVLAGVLQPWLRHGITAAFVEQLIAELRHHYTYILLDLGDEPLAEPSREASVSAAALRAADQIVVVCPPDASGLHRTYMALAQAGALVDRERAGLVVNRYEPRFHESNLAQIEDALGLPLVGVFPLDGTAVQRALAEGRPVVCDRKSRLRRPLQELAERVHRGSVEQPIESRRHHAPAVQGRARSAFASLVSAVGAAASGIGAVGGAR